MLAYKYNSTTKEYIGTQVCQLDPIESEKQGREVYLLPANCTFSQPLAPQEGKAVIFNETWVYVNDYRGKTAYNAEHIFIIDYIGDTKSGDKILTNEQIEGLNNGTLVFKDGQIIEYIKPVKQQIEELEKQIEQLNLKMLRDFLILSDSSASQEDKQEAQTYFNTKKQNKEELIKQINALKN